MRRPPIICNHKRRARTGLCDECFAALLEKQGGVCAICGNTDRALFADHDHETTMVRGILCVTCNLGIGMFADVGVYLRRAADYVEQAPEWCPEGDRS